MASKKEAAELRAAGAAERRQQLAAEQQQRQQQLAGRGQARQAAQEMAQQEQQQAAEIAYRWGCFWFALTMCQSHGLRHGSSSVRKLAGAFKQQQCLCCAAILV
jgi:hypothetical protein